MAFLLMPMIFSFPASQGMVYDKMLTRTHFQKKPYSSITVAIENLTSESFEENDFSGIPDLVDAINIQATGPTEAARAIRKKLKYGNVHRQLRALTILDGLIQNAGGHFQQKFTDPMLLERLRICGTGDLTDPVVKAKCKELFRQWSTLKNVGGLRAISNLHKETHRSAGTQKVVTRDESKVIRETENPFDDDEEEEKAAPTHSRNTSLSQGQSSKSSSPRTSFFSSSASSSKSDAKSKKDKKGRKKSKPFNLDAEKEIMKSCIADSSMSSTNLLNALRSINREVEQISSNQAAVREFDNCKLLRRKILRYDMKKRVVSPSDDCKSIHMLMISQVHHIAEHPKSEQWMGALLHANDELILALMTFEQLDRSIDADSDSDDELAQQAHAYKMLQGTNGKSNEESFDQNQLSGLHISPPPPPRTQQHRPPPPPRPVKMSPPKVEVPEPEEDDDDPFADRNAVPTPNAEKDEPRWAVI
ncbi:hypothetical protein HYFRA_00012135 [Hymenoscyphus fraxineus]|uniref:VHS domain-containing protein n=1 Tax=Hymenoscyphus fraxineus TaxID=746836 RepID=A0A9N9L6I7_9HELO|nr:hypothetical protein HYFRA_00012135 [Hymenoscyphus fraxineus]